MWAHGPSVLSAGMQVVVIETGRRPVVVGGDVAVWFGELDEPHTEGQLRLRALARPAVGPGAGGSNFSLTARFFMADAYRRRLDSLR